MRSGAAAGTGDDGAGTGRRGWRGGHGGDAADGDRTKHGTHGNSASHEHGTGDHAAGAPDAAGCATDL
jgi:hypothetical protein